MEWGLSEITEVILRKDIADSMGDEAGWGEVENSKHTDVFKIEESRDMVKVHVYYMIHLVLGYSPRKNSERLYYYSEIKYLIASEWPFSSSPIFSPYTLKSGLYHLKKWEAPPTLLTTI